MMNHRLFWFAPAVSVSIGIAFGLTTILLTQVISLDYTIILFLVTPLFYGFFAGFLYGRLVALDNPRDIVRYVAYTTVIPCVFAALILLLMLAEGLICLVMASPFIFASVLIGALFAEGLHRLLPKPQNARRLTMLMAAAMYAGSVAANPLFIQADAYRPITTSIVISAPPEVVWTNVIAFSDLPPPAHWLFKTGIAYPLRARIVGEGVGAVRYCEFTTGSFIEPITVWDAPNLLRFNVASNPEPLEEVSPWGEIHPPHLDGFMVSRQGEFRLIRLDDGGTRLEGTTWYRHGLGPQWYWSLWSDYIIHRIHSRVLAHIKNLSEGSAG